jgi:hypothetical protein
MTYKDRLKWVEANQLDLSYKFTGSKYKRPYTFIKKECLFDLSPKQTDLFFTSKRWIKIRKFMEAFRSNLRNVDSESSHIRIQASAEGKGAPPVIVHTTPVRVKPKRDLDTTKSDKVFKALFGKEPIEYDPVFEEQQENYRQIKCEGKFVFGIILGSLATGFLVLIVQSL